MAEMSKDAISIVLLALSSILSFIFEIAMPFDIPYNFRQSLPCCDTITSPMIYDQSLLGKGGREGDDLRTMTLARRA